MMLDLLIYLDCSTTLLKLLHDLDKPILKSFIQKVDVDWIVYASKFSYPV